MMKENEQNLSVASKKGELVTVDCLKPAFVKTKYIGFAIAISKRAKVCLCKNILSAQRVDSDSPCLLSSAKNKQICVCISKGTTPDMLL